MTTSTRITEKQKRTVHCDRCGARPGRPCQSSRTPGANTLGGGWGGPPSLDRSHDERRAAFVAANESAANRLIRRLDSGLADLCQ